MGCNRFRRLAVALIVLAAGLAGAGHAQAAAVINVPAAAATIQAGIDAASDGDTVVVAPGTYHERLDFKGKAIEVRSAAGPASTVIDGDGTGTVVKLWSGETRASVLRGFTITGGRVPADLPEGFGAGISIRGASPTIIGNVITANETETAPFQNGAGIGAGHGSPLIQDNVIEGNHAAGDGGGIAAGGTSQIVGNRIENNSARSGAGLFVHGEAVVVRNNMIRGNQAENYAGGVYIMGSYDRPVLVGNLIADNTAGDYVGVYLGSTSPTLLHNTIVNNVAPYGSTLGPINGRETIIGNIIAGPAGGPANASLVSCSHPAWDPTDFAFNDVYGTPTPYLGCVEAGYDGFHDNVSVDPRFVSPTDFRLQPTSLLIDRGDPNIASLPPTDLAGAVRITDGNGDGVTVADIGAYEAPATVAGVGQRFHPLTPSRILDTRVGVGAPAGPVGPASALTLQVTGRGGVPATGVSAVALNVTVTEPTAESFLTIWPAGLTRPLASNLNYLRGQTVPNLVMVKVGDLGRVTLYNHSGATHAVADVAGWYGEGESTSGSRYTTVVPARILDTRTGNGAPAAKLHAGSALDLQVTGVGGVPSTGVSAVVLNVTVTEPTAISFLTAWPAGVPRPLASNLNYAAGQTVPNLVVVKVGDLGRVSLYNHSGSTHVVADVAGWFGADGAPGGSGFTSVVPARILDTRIGVGAGQAAVGPASSIDVQVTGRGGVPAAGVSAVVLNIVATQPTAISFLTAWPTGLSRPLASNLNYAAGQTVPNLVVVKVGAGGKVSLYNHSGSTHVVADVAGWFSG